MALEVDGIRVTFKRGQGAVSGLSGCSFAVRQGEIVALLGRSGSGKTTLLNVIAGLLKPQAGRVAFQHSTGRNPPFAYMFQEDRLLPWRTAEANIRLATERLGVPRNEGIALARDALARVSMPTAGDLYPSQLSGGMRSRVALARALALRAPVLLLDEPFGKLDPATRSEMHRLLLKLRADFGFAALLVTHDPEEAVTLADRALVIDTDGLRELPIEGDRTALVAKLNTMIADDGPSRMNQVTTDTPERPSSSPSRRQILAGGLGALATPFLMRTARAQTAPFRVGYWATGIQLALIELIQEKKLFEKYGLAYEFVRFADVNGNTIALATDRIDGAFSVSGAGALDLAAKKRPIKIVLSTQIADGQLVTRNPDIKTIADLRGKTIGMAPAGSAGAAYTKAFLARNHKLEPSAYRPIGGGEARLVQLLIQGEVDAALLREVSVVQYTERLKLKSLANQLTEWAKLAGDGALPPLGAGVIQQRILETRRPEAVAFIAAVMDAIAIGVKEPDLISALMSKSLKLAPDEAEAYAKTWPVSFHGKLEEADIKSFDTAQQLFVAEGSLEALADLSYFDPSVYRDAAKALKR